MTTREDIKLYHDWLVVQEEYVTAKEAHYADIDDEAAKEEFSAAKAKMSAMRTHWRQVREYLKALQDEEAEVEGNATVAPETIEVVAAVKGTV